MDDASFRALLAYNLETKLLDDVYRSAVKTSAASRYA